MRGRTVVVPDGLEAGRHEQRRTESPSLDAGVGLEAEQPAFTSCISSRRRRQDALLLAAVGGELRADVSEQEG